MDDKKYEQILEVRNSIFDHKKIIEQLEEDPDLAETAKVEIRTKHGFMVNPRFVKVSITMPIETIKSNLEFLEKQYAQL